MKKVLLLSAACLMLASCGPGPIELDGNEWICTKTLTITVPASMGRISIPEHQEQRCIQYSKMDFYNPNKTSGG